MAPKRVPEDRPPAAAAADSEETEEEEQSENDATAAAADSEETEEEEQSENDATAASEETEEEEQSENDATEDKGGNAVSGDEVGSDSDTQSDKTQTSPSASAYKIQPIVSMGSGDSSKPKKISSTKCGLNPTVIAGLKRTNESDIKAEESKKKRKKKVSNGNEEDAKKRSGAQRLWNVDDEVAILRGMIEYKTNKGVDPVADMGVFYEFIKDNLCADISKNQLMDKIRRLKKKYQDNAEKGANSEDPVLSKPHEQKCFEICKKIWGAAAVDNVKNKRKQPLTPSKVQNSLKINEEANGEVKTEPEGRILNSSFIDELLGSGKLFSEPDAMTNLIKEALPLIGTTEAKELETRWNHLREEEFQVFSNRMELVHESAKLLLEVMKSSKFYCSHLSW